MTMPGREEFELLKKDVLYLFDRVRELEGIVFADEENILDPLEIGHQRFATTVRAKREANQ